MGPSLCFLRGVSSAALRPRDGRPSSKLTRDKQVELVMDLADEPVGSRMSAAAAWAPFIHLGRERRRPETARMKKRRQICEETPILAVPRQGCLEEDAHELGPAPGDVGGRAAGLGAERCWPEQHRIEPRRPPRSLLSSPSSNGH